MEINKQKANEAIRRGTLFSFIPHRLEITGRPEWNNFPFNVLFMNYAIKDGQHITGTALYEPDFYTYRKDGHLSLMRYHNVYGGECYLIIAYDEKNKRYHGKKYVNGKSVGSADGGNDWKNFFIHLTMMGLVADEQCRMETEK